MIRDMVNNFVPDEHFFTQPRQKNLDPERENSIEIHSFLNLMKDKPTYRPQNMFSMVKSNQIKKEDDMAFFSKVCMTNIEVSHNVKQIKNIMRKS